MKKSLVKNNFKEISKTRRRFFSIMIMAFLGVGFYAGLSASSPDMSDSLDKYTDSNKMYDIEVISTLGLTDEDVAAIKEVEGISEVYGIQTKDTMSYLEEKENICKIIEYNENINVPTIVSGRLPENSSECLIDEGYSITEDMNSLIGQKIVLENDDTNEDGTDVLTQKEFTIVGIVDTPIYISNERGNTTIGNGNIEYFIYVKDDVINLDYYTEICAIVEGADEYVTNSDEYLNLVNPVIEKVEAIKEERESARYEGLINDATQKVNEAQEEYDSKKTEVEQELQEAEQQLNEAQEEITNSEQQLDQSEKEITNQETSANKQFQNAEAQIQSAESELTTKENELEQAKTELEAKKKEAQTGIEQINAGIASAQANLETLQKQKEALTESKEVDTTDTGIVATDTDIAATDTTDIDALIYQAEATIQSLNAQKQEITNSLESAETQITEAETQISNAKTELQSQKETLATSKQTTSTKIASAKAKITSGKAELESGKATLEQSKQEYESAKQEAQTQLNEAQEKINDAKNEIGKIEKATWYIQDRMDNTGYSNIFDAIKTMSNISKLFPVIFYLVAVLISLTSMTRMIEEERIEIGTLKSLGYTNFQIIIKYVLYAFLACIIGGILGMTVGFYLLPSIVWTLYSSIYTIPNFYLSYQFSIGLAGTAMAFLCIGGATILVAYKELKEMPAVLMRPKAPKNGKKIFLERIGFIWKRFNFSKKVTMRNIFRYKKRAIMTIVGIAGCTGLMLTGFGIKDSIIDIPTSQFGGIFKYDSSVTISDTNNLSEIESYLLENDKVDSYSEVCANTGKLKKGDSNSYDTTVFAPNTNEDFKKVCNVTDYLSNQELELSNDGIIITDKVAEFIGAQVGDEVILIDGDNIEYNLKVAGIAKNYVSNYVYMSKEFYQNNIKNFEINMLLVNAKEDTSDDELSQMSEELLNIEGVASVSVISTLIQSIGDMLGELNYVVLILVVASALLAFVVLYNLANINIGERQREIATLKVLGFYDKEVDNYINKENIIFTIIGILLRIGIWLFLN